jgi:A/G-specific adenine glycosylase
VKKSRKVPTPKEIVVVEFYKQKVKLKQREGRFLHGLWGFPSSDNAKGESIGEVRHQYTHFKLELSLFLFHCKEEKRNMFTREEIEDLALSTVDRKIVRLLEKRGLF